MPRRYTIRLLATRDLPSLARFAGDEDRDWAATTLVALHRSSLCGYLEYLRKHEYSEVQEIRSAVGEESCIQKLLGAFTKTLKERHGIIAVSESNLSTQLMLRDEGWRAFGMACQRYLDEPAIVFVNTQLEEHWSNEDLADLCLVDPLPEPTTSLVS